MIAQAACGMISKTPCHGPPFDAAPATVVALRSSLASFRDIFERVRGDCHAFRPAQAGRVRRADRRHCRADQFGEQLLLSLVARRGYRSEEEDLVRPCLVLERGPRGPRFPASNSSAPRMANRTNVRRIGD